MAWPSLDSQHYTWSPKNLQEWYMITEPGVTPQHCRVSHEALAEHVANLGSTPSTTSTTKETKTQTSNTWLSRQKSRCLEGSRPFEVHMRRWPWSRPPHSLVGLTRSVIFAPQHMGWKQPRRSGWKEQEQEVTAGDLIAGQESAHVLPSRTQQTR